MSARGSVGRGAHRRTRGGGWGGPAGVLISALSCGDAAPSEWTGTQRCEVVLPPEEEEPTDVPPPVERVLDRTGIVVTGTGFYFDYLTFGPIGSFSCFALQANARYTSEGPGPRGLVLDPFECTAADARTYTLEGEGQAEFRSFFLETRFRVWFDQDEATLNCITRFQREPSTGGADAGVPEPFQFPPPFGSGADAGTPP